MSDVPQAPRLVAVSDRSAEPEDEPRRIVARHSAQDAAFVHSVRATGFLVLVIVGSIGVFLGAQAFPTLNHYGLGFFTEQRWLCLLYTSDAADE